MNLINDVLNERYDNHVLPFFWQKDNTSDELVIDYIEKMFNADIHAFCVESRPFTGFLTDSWWQRMDLILKEAKKRKMKVWILDDVHFPTGYANGAVKKHDKLGKRVLKHHIINVIGPEKDMALHIHQPYPADPGAIFLAAIAVQEGKTLNLGRDIRDDYLYFDLPAGRWDVYVMTISTITDVAPDYINVVDRQSCRLLIDTVYESHYAHYSEEFGKTIAGFFSDEPGFQNEKGRKSDSLIGKDMPLPWSTEVQTQLLSEFGDDYVYQLPHLWRVINGRTPKIRKKFMDIVTRLYQHNFTEQIGDWCRAHNVKYIGHIIEDRESHARLGVGAGHYFRSLTGQDMSGSDIISNQLMPGLDSGDNTWARGKWDGEFFHYMIGKMTASLANINPQMHGNAMCEVFGAYGWHEGLPLMKWILDHQVAQGINYFVPHAFSPVKFPDSDCPPHFYAQGHNPQFRYFGLLMKYINKLATVFSDGETRPQIAVLYHAEAEWTGHYLSTQKVGRILNQRQVDYDIVPNDVFEEGSHYMVDLNHGLIINGRPYSLLLIPYAQYISSALYRFILSATKTRVIFVDGFPSNLSDEEEKFDLQVLQEHSECLTQVELKELLDDEKFSPLQLGVPQPQLTMYRYFKAGQVEYLLLNEDPVNTIDTQLSIPESTEIAQVDLLDNQMFQLSERRLVLAPLASCIVVPSSESALKQRHYTHEVTLEARVKISFATAEDYPIFTSPQELKGYPNISKQIAPDFAGTIRYILHFNCAQALSDAELVLNRVYEIAEVSLNQQSLGVRFCTPYTITHCQLRAGSNTLVIDVTNTLDKKIYEKHSAAVAIKPSGLLAPLKVRY